MGGMISGIGQYAMAIPEAVSEQGRINQEAYLQREYYQRMAADSLQRGAIESGRIRQAGSAVNAQQRVAYANSGVDVGTGTAAQVQANSATTAELDAQTAKNNAASEAWGYGQALKQVELERRAKSAANERKFYGTVLGSAGKFLGGGMGFS